MNVGDLVSWTEEEYRPNLRSEMGQMPKQIKVGKHGRVLTFSNKIVAVAQSDGKIIFKKRSEIFCLGPAV